MKFAIIGASGPVGRALIARLATAGHEGLAISRSMMTLTAPGWCWRPRATVLSAPQQGTGFDVAIHLEVRQHLANPSPDNLAEFQRVNVQGVSHWLDWCDAAEIKRFVYFSSVKAVTAGIGPTDELAPGPPTSAYGRSKWAAERLVEGWATDAPYRHATIFRPAVIYGSAAANNISAMVEAIRCRRFFLIGAANNVKSLVHIDNVTAAVSFLLAQIPAAASEIYNVVDRESFSVRALDAAIRLRMGRAGNSPTIPVQLAMAAARVGDGWTRISGRSFIITTPRIRALMETSHFSGEKLAAAGFNSPVEPLSGIELLPR